MSREIKPYFERSISPFVDFLSQKGVHPNFVTLLGFTLIVLGSAFLYYGMGLVSFLLLGTGALLDAVDGALARRRGLQSDFGAFLDSTVDRFSDALPFIALSLYYAEAGQSEGVFLSTFALISSFGVSYTRARAESLGVYGLGGVFERTERWVVLLIGIVADMVPLALLIIGVGSLITVFQRIYETKKALDRTLI